MLELRVRVRAKNSFWKEGESRERNCEGYVSLAHHSHSEKLIWLFFDWKGIL